jgi:type III secretory pathway component EscS
MVWAMLATFLTRKPPLIQAVVVGVCVGLFVAAAAQANERDASIESTLVLVLVWGCVAGAAFYAGLASQRHHGWIPEHPGPSWLYGVYTVVWLLGILAAVIALFGAGGFKVAALTIVPLVLVAPTALHGIRSALGAVSA